MSHEHEVTLEDVLGILLDVRTSLADLTLQSIIEWGTDIGVERDIEKFVDRNTARITALLDDTTLLLSGGRLLGAAATARAGLETVAIVVEFFRRLKASIQRSNGDDIRGILSSFIFASFEFSDVSQQKTPNIMDAIRSAEKRQTGLLRVYSILCETVHPNWSGRIHYAESGIVDWSDATVQRLMVAIAISASFGSVLEGELRSFQEFVSANRKNFRNAILF